MTKNTNNRAIKSILGLVEDLIVTGNVRLPNLYKVEAMADAIETDGLETPITVWQPEKDGPFHLLRGHRRRKGLLAFKARNPEGFETMFPGGKVPLELRVGITLEEANKLKVDHGNQLALSHPHEIQMAASMLFETGATEEDVAVALRGLFEVTKPFRGKNKDKVEELTQKLSEASPLEAVKLQKQINVCIKNFHRGRVQGLKKVWRLPEIVTQARFFQACGQRPEGVSPTEYLPRLTDGNVSTLLKAFEKDLKIVDDLGLAKHSRRNPGPDFYKAWDAICEEDQKPTSTTVRSKAMAGGKIRDSAATYNSVGFRAMCALHCGDNPDVGPAVKEADELLYTAELISKHEPELWESILVARNAVQQRMVAEARAQAEAQADAEGNVLDPDTGEVVA